MKNIKFEYKITLAYLLVGSFWIIFSDKILSLFVEDTSITLAQTFKGWFYVTVTALLFYFFIKKHLTKLREAEKILANHKRMLETTVREKTHDLEFANKMLNATNQLINSRNKELKTSLENLRKTQQQLIQAEKMASLGVLTAGVAHEINNPLNYIMGAYVGLQRNYEANSFAENQEQVAFLLDALKTGIERSTSIVQGLNKFNHNSDSYNEECNLHEIIDNCIRILQYQLRPGIGLNKDYFKKELLIKGNTGGLHQVFTNVLINAIQAINEQGSIHIATRKAGKMIQVEISDTGHGISPEHIKKITDPFFTTKSPGQGTGLGLSISYNIIKQHQGSMDFQSELGKGTSVTISLPLK
ncbi:MAG: ATP-binding protein [Smithellaceae bacterium]|nr:ATP-binding protein [Smithellaceae bacterium]